jgi:TP901 family phage tail tape measure protein
MAAAGTEVERLIVRIVGDASSFLKTFQQAASAAAHFAGSVKATFSAVGDAVASAGEAVARHSVGAFADFDQAMTESTSIMRGLTDGQLARMKEAVFELSSKHAKGPADLAKSFYFMASAGLSAEESINSLQLVTRFATAGAFDIQKATDMLTASMNALGMKSDDANVTFANMTRISDVLVRATTLAQGSTEQFAQALTRDAASVAKQYNIPLEETVATLAAFHDANIKGAMAGNTFGRMIRLLMAASARKGDLHKQLGFSVFDDNTGKLRAIPDIMQNLGESLARMTPQMRSATLTAMGFQVLSQKALGPLFGESSKIRNYTKALNEAGGETDRVAQKQMASFTNQAKIMWNTITILAIELGEKLAPSLRAAGDVVRTAAMWFRKLDPATKATVYWWVQAGLAVAGLTAGVKALAAALGFLGVAKLIATAVWFRIALEFVVLKAAMLAFTVAMGLVKIAFAAGGIMLALPTMVAIGAAAVVAGVALYAVFRAAKDVFGLFASANYSNVLGQVGGILGGWWEMLKNVAQVARTDLPAAWGLLKAGLAVALSQVRDALPPLWTLITRGFDLAWTYAAARFRYHFLTAFVSVMEWLGGKVMAMARAVTPEGLADVLLGKGEKKDGPLKQAEKDANTAAKAYKRFRTALGGFDVPESQRTKDLKADFDKLNAATREAKVIKGFGFVEDLPPDHLLKNLTAGANAAGQAVKQGLAVPLTDVMGLLKGVDAVAYGSSAALTRLGEMSEAIWGEGKAKGRRKGPPGGAQAKGPDAAGAEKTQDKLLQEAQKQTDILEQLRDEGGRLGEGAEVAGLFDPK